MIALTLPWPPSVNRYWRHPSRGPLAGRTLLSEDGRHYRALAKFTLAEQNVPAGFLRGRIAIEITAHPPDRRARDLDNMLKAPLDALTHSGVIRDDADIDDLRITRGDVVPNGRVYIVLRDASTNPQECST